MGGVAAVSGIMLTWGPHSVPAAQVKLKSFSAKIVQLLKEWTEAFPYDFQDEKALGELKAIAHRVTQCDEVRPFFACLGVGGALRKGRSPDSPLCAPHPAMPPVGSSAAQPWARLVRDSPHTAAVGMSWPQNGLCACRSGWARPGSGSPSMVGGSWWHPHCLPLTDRRMAQ